MLHKILLGAKYNSKQQAQLAPHEDLGKTNTQASKQINVRDSESSAILSARQLRLLADSLLGPLQATAARFSEVCFWFVHEQMMNIWLLAVLVKNVT